MQVRFPSQAVSFFFFNFLMMMMAERQAAAQRVSVEGSTKYEARRSEATKNANAEHKA